VTCPQTDRWLEELAWNGRSADMTAHLETCARCRSEVEAAERDTAMVGRALRGAPPAARILVAAGKGSRRASDPGAREDRQRLREALGRSRQLPPGSPEPVHPAARDRRRFGRLAAAVTALAAAAVLLVSFVYAFGLVGGEYRQLGLFNPSTRELEGSLPDGTRVTVSPGGSAAARGRDDARGVRQLIVLESGWIDVAAPKAAPGETACRVETPDGMWVETVGTAFRVTRLFEDGKGRRAMDRNKLTGAVTALLLIAVTEGSVRAGGPEATPTAASAGERAEVREGGEGSGARVAWGRPAAGLIAGLAAPPDRLEEEQPLPLAVRIYNAGSEALRLPGEVLAPWSWRVKLSPEGEGDTLVAAISPPAGAPPARPDLELAPGATREVKLTPSRWLTVPAPQTRGKGAPKVPGRGRYVLTAEYSAAGRAGLWSGSAVTGRQELRIVESPAKRRERFKTLTGAVAAAETAFAAARGKQRDRLYVKYVLAAVKSAETADPDSADRKALGLLAADEVRNWLKHQDQSRYRAPPEGVLMWMYLHLGRGLVFAGETEKACSQGFDECLKFSPTDFDAQAAAWAWRVHLTARLCKALALADAGEWKRAAAAVDAKALALAPAANAVLLTRAAIVRARCLGKLRKYQESAREFQAVLKSIERIRAAGGPDARHADDLRSRAVTQMGEMVGEAVSAGVEIVGSR
jgi:hypothetical protein